ncbi:Sulfotransferase 1C2, partial [Ophiophagus hannah]
MEQGRFLTSETYPALDEVEGVPLLKSTCNEWSRIQCFQAKPNDILICTYPKSGTTWIQEIVDMIQQDGDLQKCQRASLHYRHPFIEWAKPYQPLGVDQADRMPSPRTLKTHLPIQLLPKSFWMESCKVFIAEAKPSPEDLKNSVNEQYVTLSWNMGGIFEDFHGRQGFLPFSVLYLPVAWGSWYNHVKDWWRAKDTYRVLYLFYEDLKKDPKCEIQKITQFIGKQVDMATLDKIVHHTSFEVMKQNPMVNRTIWCDCVTGTVGDWKHHFTVAENELFDEDYLKKMSYTGLSFTMEL